MVWDRFFYLYTVKKINTPWIHAVIGLAGLVSDQATKIWAVARFAEPDGTPRHETIPVIGDLLRFQLDYNEGAAFSSRPQEILPFLHPTLFFGVLTVVAVVALVYFYRSLPKQDSWSRLGVAFILAGALGNLSDRFRIGKVVDFISSDFPDWIMPRWPTFNIADSLVLIGISLVFLGPVFYKRMVK